VSAVNRKIIGYLFAVLGFLIWLYVSSHHSAAGYWWSVWTLPEKHNDPHHITIILDPSFYEISPPKVIIGSAVFILLGVFLTLLIPKSRQNA
jgi:hypothetical protein